MSSTETHGRRPKRSANFLSTIRERWWIILLAMAILGAAGLGISLVVEPRYAATAQVVYSAREAQLAAQALTSAGTGAPVSHNILTDALVLETSAFAKRVSEELGGSMPPAKLLSALKVSVDPELDVIRITAVDHDPARSADIATAFATQFVETRKEDIRKLLIAAQTFVEARVEALNSQEASSTAGAALKQQLSDLALLLSTDIADYQLLQAATVPTSPYFPKPLLNLLVGLAVGLVIGTLSLVLISRFDRRIKDEASLEELMSLPVLGSVPLPMRSRERKRAGSAGQIGFQEGREDILESIRVLRSNLKVRGFGGATRTLLISSTTPQEGKSPLATHLALGMALSGDRVVLVDADLRNPTIHRDLGIPNEPGLGDVLLDSNISWSSAIQAVDLAPFVGTKLNLPRRATSKDVPVSKFLCLTSGSLPASPAEVLESEAMTDLLVELQGISDYVILEGPPMLLTSDSLVLARSVDAVVLTVPLAKQTEEQALELRQLLQRAEIAVLGIVVCGAPSSSREAYYHRYSKSARSAQARLR